MKLFEEWFTEKYGQVWALRPKEQKWTKSQIESLWADAVRYGMLAAADIAERMYFTHTPDDGVISGEGVADEIRKRANDI